MAGYSPGQPEPERMLYELLNCLEKKPLPVDLPRHQPRHAQAPRPAGAPPRAHRRRRALDARPGAGQQERAEAEPYGVSRRWSNILRE